MDLELRKKSHYSIAPVLLLIKRFSPKTSKFYQPVIAAKIMLDTKDHVIMEKSRVSGSNLKIIFLRQLMSSVLGKSLL